MTLQTFPPTPKGNSFSYKLSGRPVGSANTSLHCLQHCAGIGVDSIPHLHEELYAVIGVDTILHLHETLCLDWCTYPCDTLSPAI